MGIEYFILDRGEAILRVGGVENRLGSLRGIGKSHPGMKEKDAAAARRWAGKTMPPAVIAMGSATGGAEGLVIAWEPGLGMVSDWNWDDLRVLGVARFAPGGGLDLYQDAYAREPMSQADAQLAGIVNDEGKLLPGRRPRITEAEIVTGYERRYRNPSSLGPVIDVNHRLILKTDQRSPAISHEFELYTAVTQDAVDQAPVAMIGMTKSAAYRWAYDHELVDRVAIASAVSIAGGGSLRFRAGDLACAMAVCQEAERPGFMVRGNVGGAGFPQSPAFAFLDVGDRLAGNNSRRQISLVGPGRLYLTVEAAGSVREGLGIALLAGMDGRLTVTTGSPFPPLEGWPTGAPNPICNVSNASEFVDIAANSGGPFLSDFALYLREVGTVCVDARAGKSSPSELPSFGDWLEKHGITYGAITKIDRPRPGTP